MRVRCPCGSEVFLVHTPPANTEPSLRKVGLICEKCRKTWKLQDASLPDVDSYGVLKSENEESTREALVKGAISVLNGNPRWEGYPHD